MSTSAATAVTALLASAGARDYLGEPVTVLGHLLQAASLAEAAAAPPALVAAALLHDIGHLIAEPSTIAGTAPVEPGVTAGGPEGGGSGGWRVPPRGSSGDQHAELAAQWLARWFGPEVTEPVRLHVAAKRYLCGTGPGYCELLSPASRHALSVQGGPMGEEEARQFAATPFARQAVRVRRWDDHAKQPGVAHQGLEHFLPMLRQLAGGGQQA
jgi:gamma-butyrobetaine dioxygenase